MMRSRPAASSLQKTYDECYLMCSTAVYFEGQNNEEEALRSWRNALETIYYHNAYRVPATYVAKTETEKALQDSIRALEVQCRERVDLLEALRESRREAQEKEGGEAAGGKREGVLKGKNTIQKAVVVAASAAAAVSAAGAGPTGAGAGAGASPGWIGDGTIPAVDYDDLSKPQTLPGRPPPVVSKRSSESIQNTTNAADEGRGAFLESSNAPALRVQSNNSSGKSRGSSPDRRKPMLTTLRSADAKKHIKKKDSPKRKDLRPAASKAAGLAWGSLYPSPPMEKSASEAALASSHHSVSSDSGPTRSRDQDQKARSSDEKPRKKVAGRAEDPDDSIPSWNWREPSSALHRSARRTSSTMTPIPQPSTPRSEGRRGSASFPYAIDTTPKEHRSIPSPSPRPTIKPKPVALRSPKQPSSRRSPTLPAENSVDAGYRVRSSSKSQTNHTTTQRSAPGDSRKPDELTPAVRNLSLANPKQSSSSTGTPRRSPQAKPKITPPSSDQESSDRGESSDEGDGDIFKIMQKLPKGVDIAAARQILNDIVVRGDEVHWDDIAGLDAAKKALKEAVVYPFLRPDLFSGLREPARGMLLFGPPGTGKTMLARAVATESKSTFFSVSASTLTSKWHGESEKLVRALFSLAKALAPSIIFVDEIDSLLSSRSSGSEHEASRRSKTEFLIQWSDLQRAAAGREKKEGDATRVLVLAATNLPWDIDEAARRRFVRRQYIPLPEHKVREEQLRRLLSHQKHELTDEDIEVLVHVIDDITALAKDAAMGPLRNLGEALLHTPMDQIRPIRFQDFEASLYSIRPSVSKDGLKEYEEWARQYGERGG
ncbi:hypothetical protein ASPZODRAFT_1413494 [Penicilliopsis zonata CBS 506.65]|uniref:AAA+ ATPase domain-containing protein n=1 Tax=Penicilliopsis zonata CBS 506.65 TaxID=1073090 RepID=A0A1L9SPJ8_9EURO|nr:hypothetical protein ASPZODRAFT_1413494 [Penicilliopsis zonata CBS 506.65]OJJ49182.1 hypothetical protein ASPZODRAFT_1413494 [Penicilliopsis zonata CBS 506.65]